jgi:hypothetical protein
MQMLVALLLLFAGPATAATITVEPQPGGKPAVIAVEGELRFEDIETFRFRVAKLSHAVVGFGSNGGNLLAGIRIGEIIHHKGYLTVVPSRTRCASACAIAWLGGARRFMGEDALIGFHAAYQGDGIRQSEAATANAILGAYLNRIGLPERANIYITMAAPNAMTWLTSEAAAKYGIEVRSLPDDTHRSMKGK